LGDEANDPRTTARWFAEAQALAGLGVWEWDLAADRVAWSAGMYSLLGLAPGAGAPSLDALLDRVHVDDRARVEWHLTRARSEAGVQVIEYRIVCGPDEVRTLRGRTRRLAGDDGRAWVFGTEQAITEVDGMSGLRTTSVAALASGVAHEINNPLATIATHLALLDEHPASRDREGLLGDARAAVERIRDVVRGLGTVARADDDDYRAPRIRPSGEPVASTASQRGRVLIVDDEVAFARSLRRLLSSEHDVAIATNGREALARLRTGERFDAILCDLMMPEMTGADLHVALADLAPDQAERIIFVTGDAFSLSSQHFLENITNPCFEKPCDLQELRAAVRQRVAAPS
jgi:CheY-like chemotaxis protein